MDINERFKYWYSKWYAEIDYWVEKFGLDKFNDTDDLRQTLWLTYCQYEYANCNDRDKWIRTAVCRHIGSIIKHRRRSIPIETMSEDDIDRYLALAAKSSNHKIRWDDFDFSFLSAKEYQVIEQHRRQDKTLTQIAKEQHIKYITVAKRFERGIQKIRDNKEIFLGGIN